MNDRVWHLPVILRAIPLATRPSRATRNPTINDQMKGNIFFKTTINPTEQNSNINLSTPITISVRSLMTDILITIPLAPLRKAWPTTAAWDEQHPPTKSKRIIILKSLVQTAPHQVTQTEVTHSTMKHPTLINLQITCLSAAPLWESHRMGIWWKMEWQ